MGKLRRQILRLFFAALYVLSATTLGFAHVGNTGARAAGVPVMAAEYLLPDGSVPDICFGEMDDDEGGKPLLKVCEACLLVSVGALIPHAPGIEMPVRDSVEIGTRIWNAPLLAARHLFIQQPRAPPSLI